jgi:pSer/pThr/pTyr-binding forkhead associated (FHA) protein
MRAWLERDLGPKVIQVHALGGCDFLGSGEGSLVPIEGRGVPRRQCAIVRDGQVFRLRDVRSTRSGTLVNYSYVRDAVLVPGDQVQVGETVLRFNQIARRLARGAGGEKVIRLDDHRAAADPRRRDSCP